MRVILYGECKQSRRFDLSEFSSHLIENVQRPHSAIASTENDPTMNQCSRLYPTICVPPPKVPSVPSSSLLVPCSLGLPSHLDPQLPLILLIPLHRLLGCFRWRCYCLVLIYCPVRLSCPSVPLRHLLLDRCLYWI